MYAHYDGFDTRLTKGALLALHTVASDSLVAWEQSERKLKIAKEMLIHSGWNSELIDIRLERFSNEDKNSDLSPSARGAMDDVGNFATGYE